MGTLVNYRSSPWSALNDDFLNLFGDFARPLSVMRSERGEFPRCDVDETDEAFLMNLDLPGVKKENINIEVNDRVMTVTGERKGETSKDGYSERFYGNFQRSFSLPEHIDTERIEAHYENGVLQVALPKAAAKVGRRIVIGHGEKTKGIFSKLVGHVKNEEQRAV